ncbi:hypothetical protein [Eubacterium sp.]|uniref:hypothetical protein n=1 Tax=Eubacterium sp. TaxID=142586 RepID=UPI002FC73327
MARKSTPKSASETLLDEQMGVIDDPKTSMEHEAAPKDEVAVAEPKPGEVILTGASSVFTHGISFKRNTPVAVDDELKAYLMESGLFCG